jgi:hypothetical protein
VFSFILINSGPIALGALTSEMRTSESCYDCVPTHWVFPRKSFFADNQAARELVYDTRSMQRLRTTLHDTLCTCDACKTDMELRAKAKMTLFASK